MVWTGEHRGFAVMTFFENGRSVIATQRAFRQHFNIPVGGNVPGGNAIRRWAKTLKNTCSTATPSAIGRPRTVRTPENVILLRNAIEQSSRRSKPADMQLLWACLADL